MNLCQLIGIDGLIFLELVPWKYEEGLAFLVKVYWRTIYASKLVTNIAV